MAQRLEGLLAINVLDAKHDADLGRTLVDHLDIDARFGQSGAGCSGYAYGVAHSLAHDHDQ